MIIVLSLNKSYVAIRFSDRDFLSTFCTCSLGKCDRLQVIRDIRYGQWRTQEIAKGGGAIFRGHEKLTTFFFLVTDPNSTSIVSNSERGGICPSNCFLVFFKPSKINQFSSPKGGAMDPWPPLGTPLVMGIMAEIRSQSIRK
jgi:hypothetical protein